MTIAVKVGAGIVGAVSFGAIARLVVSKIMAKIDDIFSGCLH